MSNFIPFLSLLLEILLGQAFIAKLEKGEVSRNILVTGLLFLHSAMIAVKAKLYGVHYNLSISMDFD